MKQDQILDEGFIMPSTSIQASASGGRSPNPRCRRRCSSRMVAKPGFSWDLLLHLLVICLLFAPCWLGESAAQPQFPGLVNEQIKVTPSTTRTKGVFQYYASVNLELEAGFSIWIRIPKELAELQDSMSRACIFIEPGWA